MFTRLILVGVICLLALIALPNNLSAASWGYGSSIYTLDNVGIGTTSPSDPLHIVNSNPGNGASHLGKVYIGEGVGSWWIAGGRGTDGKGYNNIATNSFFYNGWKRREWNKEAWIMSNYVTNDNTGYYKIFHSDPQNQEAITNLKDMFVLDSFGNLRINGTFISKEIRVQSNPWADYVFDKNYKLMPLTEVEKFIQENKHLPNIPSASEIASQGISVGEMQRLQMEKIEELTLHAIQQEKENNILKTQNEELATRLNKIEKLLNLK
jgi:hypothetical protein